ncbi:MAG: site-specific integrase [Chitinophagaceae bacterium]
MPTIAVVINWRNQQNISGLYPIHIRIGIHDEYRYYRIVTPAKVKLIEWSGVEDAWVKQVHEFAFEINNKIIEKKRIIQDLIKRSYSFNKPVTFEMIFHHLKRKGDIASFYDFMDGYIKRPPEVLAENTLKKYRTALKHLKTFKRSLSFPEIDNLLIRDFHKYMQTKLKLEGAACKKYMDAIKRVIRQARKENYLDPTQMEFLFDDVKIKIPKAKRTFLEPQEIKAWKAVKFTNSQKYLERDRDMFLFQVYTGYYYKDLSIFTKDQLMIDEQYGYFIIGERDKNGNQTIIPLFKFPYASTIIDKYMATEKEKKVFSVNAIIEEAVYNRHLKDIAKMAGINKSVSNKVARHTNAQLWIRYGADRPVLSKMMGHTQEKTTKNYYDVNIPEIVEGTKRVDFKKLGI